MIHNLQRSLSVGAWLWLATMGSATSSETTITTNPQECVPEGGTVDHTVDLFPAKSYPKHSKHWDISYHNTYKIVSNKLTGTSYLLYQCGTEPPANAVEEHHLVLPVPLQDGVVVTGTVYIPHLELLGKRRDVTYVGDPLLVSSPCVIRMLDDESIDVIPGPYDEGHNASDLPKHLEENEHAVVIANDLTDPTTAGHLVVSETSETTNKAVFEWHKVYGALYNLEHRANDYFEETAARYDCGVANADVAREKRRLADEPPVRVLWARWVDGWGVTGWSLGSCPNYYCDFATDCGAEFALPTEDTPASVDCWGAECMTDDEFRAFAADVDVWIWPADDFNEVYKSKKDLLDDFRSVASKRVYDTYKSGPNTWFEQRMAEYDVVLQDFCDVVADATTTTTTTTTTSSYLTTHKREYLRNVFTEAVGSLPVCTDVDAPFVSQATECVAPKTNNDDKDDSSAATRRGGLFSTVTTTTAIAIAIVATTGLPRPSSSWSSFE